MRTSFYPQALLLECSLLYLVWRFASWIKHYKLCSTQTIQYPSVESCGKIHFIFIYHHKGGGKWNHWEIHPPVRLLHDIKWKCPWLFFKIIYCFWAVYYSFFYLLLSLSKRNATNEPILSIISPFTSYLIVQSIWNINLLLQTRF